MNDNRYFYQWDLDRVIEIADVPLGTEVHFYSPYIEEKDGLKVYAKEENGVVVADVPNIILQYAGSFQVYVWPYYTVMYAEYMVIERPKPAGYIYKETEVIYTIEDAVNRGLEKAKESGMFDGAKGDPGKDGKDGKDGADGKDGKTPYIQNGYWFIGGVNTNIKAEGRDGSDGKNGNDGTDGVSATHSWNGTTLTITSASGTSSVDLKGEKGNPGDAGYTPKKTIDYWTEDDKKEIEDYIDGAIANIDIPEGSAGPNNILDSESNGGLHQIADGVADGFDFTGKNENATYYDSSLTGTIPYGATGNFASAFGGKSAAIGKRSHAEGTTTIAKGAYSHAEGDNSVTIGADSHAEGYKTTAVAEGSHTEGARTITEGKYSHAEGIDTQTTNFAAHAEGEFANAYGRASHAEGQNTIADGNASHAEGAASEANGFASHAEGSASHAVGESAHAEGNHSYAQGNFSHTEGNNTYAGINDSGQFFGESAHAEGENTHAYGYASHTEGVGTDAYGDAQHVQGKYNIDDPHGRYAHIVGNGRSNDEYGQSNAHTVDWQGNAWFAGNVYVGGSNQDDGKRLATEGDIDEKLGAIDTALDAIIAIQESLIGGGTE